MHGRLSQPRMLKEVSHFFLSEIPCSDCRQEGDTLYSHPGPEVGVVIVDCNMIMRFANPAAEQMLGLKGEEIGQLFNYFLVVDEVSEVSITRQNSKPGIASMQVGRTEWRNEPVYCAVIRDVTHKWREKSLRGH